MIIALGQSANMRGIEGIRTAMLEAFQVHEELELDASQIADADLSFLQLGEAARKFADAEGKRLQLSAPATPALTALLERAGFLAGDNSDAIEFWFKGEVR